MNNDILLRRVEALKIKLEELNKIDYKLDRLDNERVELLGLHQELSIEIEELKSVLLNFNVKTEYDEEFDLFAVELKEDKEIINKPIRVAIF